ncbi:MAG: glycosyltransferase [Paludibacteraceae bacterium]|nr:glycosyltransferase [Paludibacteraceae bacterium]
MDKLVSAIITTHNRCELLKRAIDSVTSQSYRDIECIVVDDASDDDTINYCNSRNDIKYVRIEKEDSKGGNYARNLGIENARGEYVAFLDDDDYWKKDKIEKQMALIEEKKCDLVYCGRLFEIVTETGVSYKEEILNPLNQGDMSRRILHVICTTTTNILAKKSALSNVGLYDENLKFWQEYELTIRMAQITPFYYVDEPLSVYRIDSKDKNRLTNKYFEWEKAVRYIRNKHRNLFCQLTLIERLGVEAVKWGDGAIRAKNSNLVMQYWLNKLCFLIFALPYRCVEFTKKAKSLR